MLDTITDVGEEIMFQHKRNPEEKIGIQMGFSKDLIGALPGTRNHGGEVPHRDSPPVQPVSDHCTYIHYRKGVEPPRFHNMGFW